MTREKSDLETLKAWCAIERSKLKLAHRPEYTEDLIRAIENVISQVGTWKAKWEEAEKATVWVTQTAHQVYHEGEPADCERGVCIEGRRARKALQGTES